MFLSPPPEDDAVRALYDGARSEDGYVMNLVRAWAWRPDVLEAFTAARRLLASETTLSAREIAILNTATAARLGDAYCSLAWGTRLAHLSDAGTAGALLRGDETPSFDAREQALVAWARAVVTDPNATEPEDVQSLRAAGLSEQEIVDATLFVAFRLAFGTVNDALGARPDAQLAADAPPEVRKSVTYGRGVENSALAHGA